MLPKPNMQSQLQKKTERFSNKKKTVQSCPLNHGKLLILSVDTHIQMFYTTLCCAVVNRHNNTFTLEETNESGNKNKQNRFYYKVHYNDGIICSYFMYFCLYQHPIADPW